MEDTPTWAAVNNALIATQPTSEPCMTQDGNTLHYELSPNGPKFFTYVNFEVISERVSKTGTQ